MERKEFVDWTFQKGIFTQDDFIKKLDDYILSEFVPKGEVERDYVKNRIMIEFVAKVGEELGLCKEGNVFLYKNALAEISRLKEIEKKYAVLKDKIDFHFDISPKPPQDKPKECPDCGLTGRCICKPPLPELPEKFDGLQMAVMTESQKKINAIILYLKAQKGA